MKIIDRVASPFIFQIEKNDFLSEKPRDEIVTKLTS